MDPNQKVTSENKYMQPYKTKKQIVVDNFIGGIAWSLGTIVGFALLAIVIGFLISRINLVPIIGDWAAQIFNHMTTKIQPPQIPLQ